MTDDSPEDVLERLDVMSQIAIFDAINDVEEQIDQEIDINDQVVTLGKTLASVLFEVCRGQDETFMSASGDARRMLPAALASFNRGFAIRMRELEDPRTTKALGLAHYH